MKTKHTPEDQWHIVEFAGFFEFTDAPFYTANSLLDLDKCPQAKENADRLLECLKALQGFSSEQIAQIKEWANTESTTLMFDYVSKNRLLEEELQELKHQFEVEYRDSGVYQNEVTKLKAEIEEYKTMESFVFFIT